MPRRAKGCLNIGRRFLPERVCSLRAVCWSCHSSCCQYWFAFCPRGMKLTPLCRRGLCKIARQPRRASGKDFTGKKPAFASVSSPHAVQRPAAKRSPGESFWSRGMAMSWPRLLLADDRSISGSFGRMAKELAALQLFSRLVPECDFFAISDGDIKAHKRVNNERLPTVERGGVFDEQVGRI